MNAPKLTGAVTVKLDEEDLAALDAEVRRRENALPGAPPMSRSFVLRELMREALRPDAVRSVLQRIVSGEKEGTAA